MPRLAICSRDLHWQWINWPPLYDTMEVSMLRLTWLTVAQHVFQPALTGRLELISRKIVSCEPGTKAIAVSRFREKLGSNTRPRYIQFRDIRDRNISGLHCIVKQVDPGVECSLYVDDFVIMYKSPTVDAIQRKLQYTINRLEKWTLQNGFTISKNKTVAMELGGDPIQFVREAKFLGLIWDTKLTFEPHIKYLKARC